MNNALYYFKWFIRKSECRINKLLCRIMDIRKVKMLQTKLYYHREIDLYHPKKLNEKILWLEYNTDLTMQSYLTDKYEVRKYVADKGYADTIVPLYGIYDNPDEIDFDKLPDQFVMKATHGCDMNYICRKREDLSVREVRKRLSLWIKTNLAYMSLEMHYLTIPPRIICEQYLESGPQEIVDYKFHCCDGKTKFILVCTDRSSRHYRDVFTPDWKPLDVVVKAENNPVPILKPEHLEDMIDMAEHLSEGIPFVRVDLYEINGKIYFGEMTFTPATGVLFHFNDEFLLEMGQYCRIEEA